MVQNWGLWIVVVRMVGASSFLFMWYVLLEFKGGEFAWTLVGLKVVVRLVGVDRVKGVGYFLGSRQLNNKTFYSLSKKQKVDAHK